MYSVILRLPFLIPYATLSIGFTPYNVFEFAVDKNRMVERKKFSHYSFRRWRRRKMLSVGLASHATTTVVSLTKPTLVHRHHTLYAHHHTAAYDTFAVSARRKVFDVLQNHHERAVFIYPAAHTHTPQWRWWWSQRFCRWTINCVKQWTYRKKCTVIGISESAGRTLQFSGWTETSVWLYDVSVFTIASSEQRRIVCHSCYLW